MVPNSQISWIGDNVRIVSALCNRYRPALVMNTSEDEAIALKMLSLAKKPNSLKIRVEKENLNQRKRFGKIWMHVMQQMTFQNYLKPMFEILH